MNLNNQKGNPLESDKEKQILNLDKSHFLGIVNRFIQIVKSCESRPIRKLRKDHGFTLLKSQKSLAELNNATVEVFDMNLNQLENLLTRFGFSIRKINQKDGTIKTIYRYSEHFLSENNPIEDDSLSQILDEEALEGFPNQQQIQKIQQAKASAKSVKSNMGKAKSETLLGGSEKRQKQQDISLQIKLEEQHLFFTPGRGRIQQLDGQEKPLAERNKAFRENFVECSKLIDSAIFQVLTAHRVKKIGENAEGLLNKVTEIYDMLSDSIENVNSAVRQVSKKSQKKESINSPGFKSAQEGFK